jgi:hypothetical protein
LSARAWVLAEYRDEQELYAAARRLRQEGYRSVDLYSPYPLQGSDEALGLRRSRVPLIALLGGIAGIASAILMQWWMNAVDYPINVGNRTLIPYPAMVPVTFELGVLLSALAIFFGILGLCGYPRTWHPVFEVEAFRSAAVDALWLGAEVKAEEAEGVAEELRRLGAAQVATAREDA